MLTLGFTNHFYTLWNVYTIVRCGRGETINGVFMGSMYEIEKHDYCQNLSMDYETAKAKITGIAGEIGYAEDLTLRGESGSWERTVRQFNNMPDYMFTFGKLNGQDIRVSDDVWQLERAMQSEPKPRARVYARRRLLELGALLKFKWSTTHRRYTNEENPEQDVFETYTIQRNYATQKQIDRLTKNDHYYTEGEKVTLEVRQVMIFGFDTQFGYSSVQIFNDRDGRAFKYMGTSPVSFDSAEWLTIKGTVKHVFYQGNKETKLQRIKIIKSQLKTI